MPKPVLLVTNHATAARIECFKELDLLERCELALYGGELHHGGTVVSGKLPLTTHRVSQRDIFALINSGRYRAVICGLGGRIALPSAYLAARKVGIPFILWASLWTHPRSFAHSLSYLPTRHIYRKADAVVTYGSHVSSYVKRFRTKQGASKVFEAPQAVDNDFWAEQQQVTRNPALFKALFVGRLTEEKGLDTLLTAWSTARLIRPELFETAELTIVGKGQMQNSVNNLSEGVKTTGYLDQHSLRRLYAESDCLVVPSLKTATFREPWGLVLNECMNQSVAVIVSDQVGAAAGGLVKNNSNGIIFTAGDSSQLVEALVTLASRADLRSRLGIQAAVDVKAFTFKSWAEGMSSGLEAAGASLKRVIAC